MHEAATFKALGDPIRLEMVKCLSKVSEIVISDLVKNINLSRQGARKHMQVLADVGLVTLKTKGRETRVALDISTLDIAKSFMAELETRRADRLLNLKEIVEKDIS
jgi:DNA-binding transcriptional ArsR family regulator